MNPFFYVIIRMLTRTDFNMGLYFVNDLTCLRIGKLHFCYFPIFYWKMPSPYFSTVLFRLPRNFLIGFFLNILDALFWITWWRQIHSMKKTVHATVLQNDTSHHVIHKLLHLQDQPLSSTVPPTQSEWQHVIIYFSDPQTDSHAATKRSPWMMLSHSMIPSQNTSCLRNS